MTLPVKSPMNSRSGSAAALAWVMPLAEEMQGVETPIKCVTSLAQAGKLLAQYNKHALWRQIGKAGESLATVVFADGMREVVGLI